MTHLDGYEFDRSFILKNGYVFVSCTDERGRQKIVIMRPCGQAGIDKNAPGVDNLSKLIQGRV